MASEENDDESPAAGRAVAVAVVTYLSLQVGLLWLTPQGADTEQYLFASAVISLVVALLCAVFTHKLVELRWSRLKTGQSRSALWSDVHKASASALAVTAKASIALVLLVVAVRWYERYERAERVWDVWKARVCTISRIERRTIGETTCMRCQANEALVAEAIADARIRERLDNVGGLIAIQEGVEICE